MCKSVWRHRSSNLKISQKLLAWIRRSTQSHPVASFWAKVLPKWVNLPPHAWAGPRMRINTGPYSACFTWTWRMTRCHYKRYESITRSTAWFFPAIASFYHITFQIFDGDDPSPPVLDTNNWSMPNKGDVLSRMIVPKSAWSSDLIRPFRIEIHVLFSHIENTTLAASFEIFFSYCKISRPPFGRPPILTP